ncbi:tetrahydromethanopterin S-methyltransferase, subunit E [Methanosalsum zhilinae DSM 4017]|uniref:Tetrahydromethanopterin S-methyltransferase subunit E n=1 Tax=Methanosalsum zhilinae (strain DSM 4017 / NBRC 107636 / OCM 62 / WeN5) TaxID=679901 RepID=F7XQ90_METZD|nr:tetrahydromethanopterin S-methyltransferase subunit E [Methanosalsum zhilinae]AEH61552.1 tetrahydromethanopterin S-methyltransferase, subunit E [Methanosalsum zhilinae DSM 4017]
MEPLIGMGVLALMGAAAAIAGMSEDLESDVGSQSNPNSQVQLAPQMMYPHRIFNKAISGEPPSNALMCAIGGTTTAILMDSMGMSVLFSVAIGALVAALAHGSYSTMSFFGRPASQNRFKQPIYLDVLRSHIVAIMAFAFVTTFSIVIISYLMITALGHPFPLALLAFIWGIAVGAIGSSTGDVHYGAERQFQNTEFGAGLNAAQSGNIVRKGEAGLRNGIDNLWFCSRFGGPATGIAFAMTVFLSGWITLVFDPSISLTIGWLSVIAGLIIVLILIIFNRKLEVSARNTYGPYKADKEEVAA